MYGKFFEERKILFLSIMTFKAQLHKTNWKKK